MCQSISDAPLTSITLGLYVYIAYFIHIIYFSLYKYIIYVGNCKVVLIYQLGINSDGV